jgi:hypothetical protein
MTPTQDGSQTNHFGDNTVIGAQGENITVHGGIHFGHEPTAEDLYNEGVSNLMRGAAKEARTLIWQAMMRKHQPNEAMFYWLLAMLSGRALKDFSPQEVRQFQEMRPRYAMVTGDRWAPGVRILSQLLDLAIPELAADDPFVLPADLPTLQEELNNLAPDQQDLIRPHLELFLSGPTLDALWEEEFQRATEHRRKGRRSDRVWMYYQPVPKQVAFPDPLESQALPADRRRMYVSGTLFAIAFGFFGAELLWHSAIGGLLAFVVALAGGLVATEADLRQRCANLRHRLEQTGSLTSVPVGDDKELASRVKQLFNRYIDKYEPNTEHRKSFKSSFAERLVAERSEITCMCHLGGASADEVRWLIRHRSCQLLQLWRKDASLHQQQMHRPRPLTVLARAVGLTLTLCCIYAVVELRAYPLTDAAGTVAVLLGAILARHCWLPVALEKERFRAESERRNRRQADIEEAFTQWSQRLEDRPSDQEMGAWLAADRAVLLNTALRHFDLARSRLIVHAFLEERAPWSRTGHSEDGQIYAEKYKILVFLLVDEGLRMVRASLDFSTGSFDIHERRDFRYDSIVAMRVTPTRWGREDFELQLTSGDPITLVARGTGPVTARPPDSTNTADREAPLKAASTADTLHLLEGIAAEGPNWLKERTWNQDRPPSVNRRQAPTSGLGGSMSSRAKHASDHHRSYTVGRVS